MTGDKFFKIDSAKGHNRMKLGTHTFYPIKNPSKGAVTADYFECVTCGLIVLRYRSGIIYISQCNFCVPGETLENVSCKEYRELIIKEVIE